MEVDDSGIKVTARVFNHQKSSTHQIELKSSTQSVDDLVADIYSTLQLTPNAHSLELIYQGRKLTSSTSIDSYAIKQGSRIHVIVKEVKDSPSLEVNRTTFLHCVKKMMSNEYSYMTRKLVCDGQTVDRIICQVPGLSTDLVAQTILKDFDMMKLLFEPANIDRIYSRHPSLPLATTELSKIVISQADQDTNVYTTPASRTNQYRLDMSEGEEEEGPEQPTPTVHTITSNQLAAALASAIPANQQTTSQASSANQNRHSQPQVAGASGHTPTHNYSAQLEQIMAMGVTNRAAALQALEAASGNLELALDLIYGGD